MWLDVVDPSSERKMSPIPASGLAKMNGLLRLPLILLAALIAVQAFLAAQIGMRLGSRLAEKAGVAENVAGGLLMLAAALVVVEKLLKT